MPWAEAESAVRRTLLSAGFHEAIASTFCSAAEAALTAPMPGQVVPLGNPLSEEAGVLRPSLVPGMLAALPAIFIATSAMCVSSNSAPSSAEPQKKSKSVPRLPSAPWALFLSRARSTPPEPSTSTT